MKTLKDKTIIIQPNPLQSIKSQLDFGFTEEEAKSNLKDSKIEFYNKKDVQEAVIDFNYLEECFNLMVLNEEIEDNVKFEEYCSKYNLDHNQEYTTSELSQVIFGDFEND